MTARIDSVEYVPATSDSYITSGHKRGSHPSGLAFGGNGTYREMYFTPATLKVYAQSENGGRLWFDIGKVVRQICGWGRLTRQRAKRIINTRPYEVDIVRLANGRWVIAKWSLQEWLDDVR